MFSRRNRHITILVIVAIIASIMLVLANQKQTTAQESTAPQGAIIRTHEHMSIPDHVFMSKAERCRLPSKEELARQTGSPVENWGDYFDGHRTIDYYGDGETVIGIEIQKDQSLGIGYGYQKLKYYSLGETYFGTGDFTFGCTNSKHRLFNPNVTRLLCENGSTRLQNLTDRKWHTVYEDDPNDYPTSYYVYKMHKHLDGFFVPRDASFIVEDSDITRGKTFQTGYLTPTIPHRNRIGVLYVRVETYC